MRTHNRRQQRVGISKRLTRSQTIVTANIIDRIKTVRAALHVPDSESAHGIRTTNAGKRHLQKCRVVHVLMDTDDDALLRIQIRGIIHLSAHFQGIDLRSRGESKRVIRERITLPIIANSIAEIEGVCGVAPKRVRKLNHHLLSAHLHVRRTLLRRGHQKILTHVIQLQIFIETDLNTVPVKIERTVLRLRTNRLRCKRVPRTALRTYASVCTRHQCQRGKQDIYFLSHDHKFQ